MSLQRNLIAAVLAVLLAGLAVGAAMTWGHAAAKVRTEMRAAMDVGRRIAQNAADEGEEQADPRRRLAMIVGDFNGDRHLRAVLRDGQARVVAASRLQDPADPAPDAFFRLVGGAPDTATIDLPQRLRQAGTLMLETDAHNEVAEAWGDLELELAFLGAFFAILLALALRTLHVAFRPMQELCRALEQVGAGDYAVRLGFRRWRELAAVQDGFHAMAARLSAVERQNRLLGARLQRIQEDERRELARDLHDEVAPFLFAVSADASLLRRLAGQGDLGAVGARADGILASVGHMQKHLRRVLTRLMPDVLLDLGLAGAIDSLVAFWRERMPHVAFDVSVCGDGLDEAHSAVVFRIVQESLSNACRHAAPSRVAITVRPTPDGIEVEVTDDGRGLLPETGEGGQGLGLIGMRDRVRSVGGVLRVANRTDATGVRVCAVLRPEPVAALAPAP